MPLDNGHLFAFEFRNYLKSHSPPGSITIGLRILTWYQVNIKFKRVPGTLLQIPTARILLRDQNNVICCCSPELPLGEVTRFCEPHSPTIDCPLKLLKLILKSAPLILGMSWSVMALKTSNNESIKLLLVSIETKFNNQISIDAAGLLVKIKK